MESVETLSYLDVADYFKIEEKDPQKRKKKIQNWLQRGIIPRNVTYKMGKDVLFLKSKLDEFVLNKIGK